MLIENVAVAFVAVFQLKILGLMVLGVLAGLIAGAIPGFTITMAVVLTLPFTFGLSAIEGLSTMIGVFVGGLSGGLMSGILTGIPGTPSSVATTFDGFPMARKGRPGLALGIGVWSSPRGAHLGAAPYPAREPHRGALPVLYGLTRREGQRRARRRDLPQPRRMAHLHLYWRRLVGLGRDCDRSGRLGGHEGIVGRTDDLARDRR